MAGGDPMGGMAGLERVGACGDPANLCRNGFIMDWFATADDIAAKA